MFSSFVILILIVHIKNILFRVYAIDNVVLSERILKLSVTAGELSSLAYEENPPGDAYNHFGFFDNEPDQAIVAQRNGYCYAAFRGTTLTWNDWKQNLIVRTEDVCNGDASGGKGCCKTRLGFWEAYNTPYRSDMEKSLRDCAKDCINKDECVVLTGHSQGGAIAAVAAVYMADLNPYVITFGQPPTIYSPCALITSDRWYRYVNTKNVESGLIGITYDPVPFAPSLGADHFGHMLMLSDDPIDVAYIGLDSQDSFSPLNVNGFESHNMVHAIGSNYSGYLDRIKNIVSSYSNISYPVNPLGYKAGSLCSQDIECATGHCSKETMFSYYRCVGTSCKRDGDCETGRCDSGVCEPKLASCMICDEDSDCMYGHCSAQFRCSGERKLMDNDCLCFFNSECHSGRCEGVRPSVCEAKLGEGAYCSESSDCLSNQCTWSFHCAPAEASPSAILKVSASANLLRSDVAEGPMSSKFYYSLSSFFVILLFLISSNGLIVRWSTDGRRRRNYVSIPDSSST